MNKLQIFNNPEFGSVRAVEINGEPMFCLADVCKALEIGHVTDVKNRLNQNGVGTNEVIDSMGRTQSATFINEANLYKTIFQSRKESAERFTDWVTREVLPSIRKNGGYIAGQEGMTDAEIMAKALLMAQKTIEERNARVSELTAENSALTVDNQIMQPKAEYFDELVDRNLLTNFTEAAKQIGLKRKVLIDFMTGHGYLYRDKKGNLLPYANKKTEGLFEVKQSTNQKTGWAGCQTLMTPKGVETFRLLCQGM